MNKYIFLTFACSSDPGSVPIRLFKTNNRLLAALVLKAVKQLNCGPYFAATEIDDDLKYYVYFTAEWDNLLLVYDMVRLNSKVKAFKLLGGYL